MDEQHSPQLVYECGKKAARFSLEDPLLMQHRLSRKPSAKLQEMKQRNLLNGFLKTSLSKMVFNPPQDTAKVPVPKNSRDPNTLLRQDNVLDERGESLPARQNCIGSVPGKNARIHGVLFKGMTYSDHNTHNHDRTRHNDKALLSRHRATKAHRPPALISSQRPSISRYLSRTYAGSKMFKASITIPRSSRMATMIRSTMGFRDTNKHYTLQMLGKGWFFLWLGRDIG